MPRDPLTAAERKKLAELLWREADNRLCDGKAAYKAKDKLTAKEHRLWARLMNKVGFEVLHGFKGDGN